MLNRFLEHGLLDTLGESARSTVYLAYSAALDRNVALKVSRNNESDEIQFAREYQAIGGLIDEIPVLAIFGAASSEGLTVRNAQELRVKETDRIATVAEGLGRMGVQIEVFDDGFHIPGGQKFKAAKVDSHGDHRIAMAFAVAGLITDGTTTIEESEAASVSFPEFYTMLREIAK